MNCYVLLDVKKITKPCTTGRTSVGLSLHIFSIGRVRPTSVLFDEIDQSLPLQNVPRDSGLWHLAKKKRTKNVPKCFFKPTVPYWGKKKTQQQFFRPISTASTASSEGMPLFTTSYLTYRSILGSRVDPADSGSSCGYWEPQLSNAATNLRFY